MFVSLIRMFNKVSQHRNFSVKLRFWTKSSSIRLLKRANCRGCRTYLKSHVSGTTNETNLRFARQRRAGMKTFIATTYDIAMARYDV